MNTATANERNARHTIENTLLFAIFWGGAWALGFLLGFG